MLWLDHLIFGDGYGLRSPSCDDVYYWVGGKLIVWSGGYGSQLNTFQWFKPNVEDRIKVCGYEMRPFLSQRGRFPLRWRVSWCFVSHPDKSSEHNAQITDLRNKLMRI